MALTLFYSYTFFRSACCLDVLLILLIIIWQGSSFINNLLMIKCRKNSELLSQWVIQGLCLFISIKVYNFYCFSFHFAVIEVVQQAINHLPRQNIILLFLKMSLSFFSILFPLSFFILPSQHMLSFRNLLYYPFSCSIRT